MNLFFLNYFYFIKEKHKNFFNLENPNIQLPIKIIFGTRGFVSYLITVNVARIYYYGLSSQGKNIKKAKQLISLVSKQYYLIKRSKFWKDEYDKINNHKL